VDGSAVINDTAEPTLCPMELGEEADIGQAQLSKEGINSCGSRLRTVAKYSPGYIA
jgi:hypothetical protein